MEANANGIGATAEFIWRALVDCAELCGCSSSFLQLARDNNALVNIAIAMPVFIPWDNDVVVFIAFSF
jgi:hypothetical protein